MSDRKQQSWLERLKGCLFGEPASRSGALTPLRAVDVSIVPAQITALPVAGPRTVEDWRQLVGTGQRVAVSWDGGPERGAVMAQGQVRTIFDETIWVWLDRELPEADRPISEQAIQILAPREDAMRLVPGRLVEESRGGSLQIAVSGRVSRIQRRDDVRARVDLPPMSAVRLNSDGRPVGLLGLRVVDLSAGGIRVSSEEPLERGDLLRLVLRLDGGQPLTPTVEVLVGGLCAQGRFGPMPERERQRIVQFVYHEEIAERRRAQAADEGAL
jgi:hypothetical protein